jgi:hypothetical protein
MSTFESVPVNRNARRLFFRNARLGTRPVAAVPDYGDALRTVDAAKAYKSGWDSSGADFPVTVRTAWAARK